MTEAVQYPQEYEYTYSLADKNTPNFSELAGSAPTTTFANTTENEYNLALRFPENIRVYDKMKRSDGQVRGTLRLVKAPIISAQWYVQPASDSPLDLQVSEFIEWNLHSMTRTWTQFLWEALLCMDYGFYNFEKVFETATWRSKAPSSKPKRVVKWKKFAPRHPSNLIDWLYDRNGGVKGARYAVHGPAPDYRYEEVDIPIEKMLRFTFDEEGGDPGGFAILRSAYPHWYYKQQFYKFDGIQKERHSVGVPEIALPVGHDNDDRRLARQLGENLRTNEKAYIIKLPNWEVGFADMPGNVANALESAVHHDLMIARNTLTQFMNIAGTEGGSRAVSSSQQDIFLKALRYVANFIGGVINQYAIPQLVDYNFNVSEYPTLRVRQIGASSEWRAISVAIHNLVNSGSLTPDTELEEWLREYIELPKGSSEALGRSVEDRIAPRGGVGRKSQSGKPGNKGTTDA